MRKPLRLITAFAMVSCAALALVPASGKKAPEPEDKCGAGSAPFIIDFPPRPREVPRPDGLFAVFTALAGGIVVATGLGLVIRGKNMQLLRQQRLLAEKQKEIDKLGEINRRQEIELAARKLVAPAVKKVFKSNLLN